MHDGETHGLALRCRTTEPGVVTVECAVVDSEGYVDKCYRMQFNSFELAREWCAGCVQHHEANDKRIRLVAWRPWPADPTGKEILGRYASADNPLTGS